MPGSIEGWVIVVDVDWDVDDLEVDHEWNAAIRLQDSGAGILPFEASRLDGRAACLARVWCSGRFENLQYLVLQSQSC
jgi:hypothetical protein